MALNITDSKRAILAYMDANIPCFMWGAPGVGKSDAARQVAASYNGSGGSNGVPIIDFRAILRDPVDLRGLPMVDRENGTARWLAPSDLPNEKRDGPEGILFMDELNAAPQAVQAACFGLVLDRKVGEYRLPDGWRIIAAGNRQSDRAAAQRMPSALANRFAHIDVEPTVDDFTAWASANAIAPEVIAFVRFRPNLLHNMDAKGSGGSAGGDLRSFPTPRAWANVSKVVSCADTKLRFQLVQGIVGEGAAVEFEGFLRVYQNLPSLDAILTAPKQTAVPTEVAALFALASGLARKVDNKTFPNALTYAKRMPKEFEVMMVIDAAKRLPAITHTQAFVQWASDNQAVLI